MEHAGIALALLLAPSAVSRQAQQPAQATAVQTLVAEEARRQRLIGVQWAVSLRGALVADAALGELDLDTHGPVTTDSEFLIASVTKAMTAAAALRMAEHGTFDLDAPIQRYVPDFPVHPDGVATPRLLLLHRGGIRHYEAGELGPALFSRHFDSAKAALVVFSDDPYRSAPGVAESYSSYGYDLVAAGLESAAGTSFTQVLEREVFQPLALERAHVPRGPLGASYSYFDSRSNTASEEPLTAPVNDYSYNSGAGNVVANARSLVRFGQAFVRPGYLRPASLDLITADLPDGPVDLVTGYATLATARYGWLVGRDSAGRLFLHATGASEAFQAGLTVFPEQDLAVAALTNTWGVNSRAGGFTVPLHVAIAAALLDAPPRSR